MFSKGKKKGTVRFAYRPENAAGNARLAGDFTQWRPIRMRKQKDGGFVAVVPLSKGTYEYKFIVDEQWITDPDNSTWAMNPYGTMNSVARVNW
jgi:1,4-alpha-glucan branching enzyme